MSGVAQTGTLASMDGVNVTRSTAARVGSPENSVGLRCPPFGSKRSATGLAVVQPAWFTSSWTTVASSGVRLAGPASLEIQGPGNHGTVATVFTRSLRLLSVAAKVCA